MQQMQSQIQQLQDTIKDKEGTIETLERQVVQAGIKDKVRQAQMDINNDQQRYRNKTEKEYYETQAQQKLMRNNLASETNYKKKELNDLLKDFQKSLDKNNNKQ